MQKQREEEQEEEQEEEGEEEAEPEVEEDEEDGDAEIETTPQKVWDTAEGSSFHGTCPSKKRNRALVQHCILGYLIFTCKM